MTPLSMRFREEIGDGQVCSEGEPAGHGRGVVVRFATAGPGETTMAFSRRWLIAAQGRQSNGRLPLPGGPAEV
jgi:hypothetical protein